MMGAAQFAAMPQGAVLINCARGALVDHAALAERCAMGTSSLRASTCSTWSRCPPTTRCCSAPNVVMTPHLAGASQHGRAERVPDGRRGGRPLPRRGEPPAHCANPDVLKGAVR